MILQNAIRNLITAGSLVLMFLLLGAGLFGGDWEFGAEFNYGFITNDEEFAAKEPVADITITAKPNENAEVMVKFGTDFTSADLDETSLTLGLSEDISLKFGYLDEDSGIIKFGATLWMFDLALNGEVDEAVNQYDGSLKGTYGPGSLKVSYDTNGVDPLWIAEEEGDIYTVRDEGVVAVEGTLRVKTQQSRRHVTHCTFYLYVGGKRQNNSRTRLNLTPTRLFCYNYRHWVAPDPMDNFGLPNNR